MPSLHELQTSDRSSETNVSSSKIDSNRNLIGRRRLLGVLGALPAVPLLGGLVRPGAPALAASTSAAAPDVDQQGLTGAWYDASTSGQGFMIEVIPDQSLIVGAWYTYDTSAGGVETQRWYTFSGAISSGASNAVVTIYQTTGGNFATTPVTHAVAAGTATLTFASCATATFVFTLNDGRSGAISLTRGLASVACTSGDTSGSSDANFALSGTFYNAATSGQGILLEVNPVTPYVFLSWYTYALDGESSGSAGQRWFTAQSEGYVAGDDSIKFTLYVSTNGTFNSAATKVSTVAVGSAQVTYASCGSAVLTYAFTSGEFAGRSGDVTLARVAATPGSCVFGEKCALIPAETDGPYPLYSILSNAAIMRSDVREDRTGVPLKVILRLVNVNNSCAAIAGAAIYIWHCDKDGVYSGYSNQTGGVNATGDTFLRGIQVTDASGQAVFETVYPGWYAGRITHIHAQAYLNDNLGKTAVITTQLAFPLAVTATVYNSTLYAAHGQNTSVTSFAQDNVFSDGTTYEMVTIAGDVASGYVATLTLGIAA